MELPTTSLYSSSGAERGAHSLNQQMATTGFARNTCSVYVFVTSFSIFKDLYCSWFYHCQKIKVNGLSFGKKYIFLLFTTVTNVIMESG